MARKRVKDLQVVLKMSKGNELMTSGVNDIHSGEEEWERLTSRLMRDDPKYDLMVPVARDIAPSHIVVGHADGMFSNMLSGAKDFGQKLGKHVIMQAIQLAYSKYSAPDQHPPKEWVRNIPGEHPTHFPYLNYMGPGTDARRRVTMGIPPINRSDAGAMAHDLDYTNIGDDLRSRKIDERTAEHLVRVSDEKLMQIFKNVIANPKPSEGELGSQSAKAGRFFMSAKMEAEDRGVASRLAFISSGI